MILLAREDENVVRNDNRPTVTARWEVDHVEPDHNPANGVQQSAFNGEAGAGPGFAEFDFLHDPNKVFANDPPRFTPPAECLVQLIADTQRVPDNSVARIQVYHAPSDTQVADLANLTVVNGQVVDPATRGRPRLSFRAAQDPWRTWNQPFFYFHVRVTVQNGPVDAETSRDFANHADRCLRVDYWHAALVDSSETMGFALRRAATRVSQEIGAVARGRTYVVDLARGTAPTPVTASVLRNTYSAIVCAHGKVKNRNARGYAPLTPDGRVQDGVNPIHCQSLVSVSAGVLSDQTVPGLPSVPKYLTYLNSCFAGFERSLADAFIAAGCRYVIAFKKIIYAPNAEAMATKFYRRWARTDGLDPARIPDAFMEASVDYRFIMEPVLYSNGAARQPDYASERLQTLDDILDYMAERGTSAPLPPEVESFVTSLVDFGFFAFRSIFNRPTAL